MAMTKQRRSHKKPQTPGETGRQPLICSQRPVNAKAKEISHVMMAMKGLRREGHLLLSSNFVLNVCLFVSFSHLCFMYVAYMGYLEMGLLAVGEGGGFRPGTARERSMRSFVRGRGRGGGSTAGPSGDEAGSSRGVAPWPKPDGWEAYSFSRTRKHFLCKGRAHDQTKPLPSLEDWRLLQSRYRETVDADAAFDDPVPPTEGHTLEDGGATPYYAKLSTDGRGRGLFAIRNIRKGELVDDGSVEVRFPDAMAWRRYVFSLPRDMACDMTDWCWTQEVRDGEYRVLMAMNIAVLMNGSSEDPNVNPESSTSSKMYALRDIKKHEELLYNYHIYPTVFKKIGL